MSQRKPHIHPGLWPMLLTSTPEQQVDPEPLLDICPKCGAHTENGFGFAGGGYGSYVHCPAKGCGYFAKHYMKDDEAGTSQRPLLIEVLLDGEVIATGTCPPEIRDLSASIGMPLVPAMLRKIADKWEASER